MFLAVFKRCECSSVVERNVANVQVEGSTPFTRSKTYFLESNTCCSLSKTTSQPFEVKKGKDNFSSLLTLNKPRVSEETNIIYNVPTKSSKKELFEIKDDLTSFLKLNLKNDFLELKFEINNEVHKEYFLTPKEKYEKLKEINPIIENLKNDLKLDF